MAANTVYSFILISLSCLLNEHSCANFSLVQDVPIADALATRLANAVAHLSKTNFNTSGPVLLLLPSKKDKHLIFEIFERLLQLLSQYFLLLTADHFHYSLMRNTAFLTSNVVESVLKPNVYIIQMHDENEFQTLYSIIKTMNTFQTFNPEGIFIIIKTTEECGNFSEHNVSYQYFTQLWKMNCMNVVVLVYSVCDFQLTAISGHPFSKENPCRVPNSGGLRYEHFNVRDVIALNISKTKVRNFNGCLFTAGIIPAPPFVVAREVQTQNETQYSFIGGVEMEIKEMMSTKFNFTVRLDVSNGYEIYSLLRRFSNGTEVGIATDMKNHKIDFALGGVSPNYRTFYMFDFSPTYKFSSFSWYVVNANFAPRWQIFVKTLSFDVWISSAIFYILVSFLYCVMELHNYKVQKTKRFTVTSITFIELLCVGFGLSATQQPRGCLKVLFFSWAAFGLHWSMAYSCTLFDLLTSPPLEKEILTIQDLKDAGIKVLSPSLYFQIFSGVNIDSVTRSVLNNKLDCMDLELCIKQFVSHRNASLMDRSEHVDYSVNFKVSKIHKLSEDLISFGVSLMANKGNPLSQIMNEVVLQAFESGLVGKWETDTAWKFNYEKNTLESYSDDSSLPLSVTVLQGAFHLLCVGLLISLLVFLGEVMVHNRSL